VLLTGPLPSIAATWATHPVGPWAFSGRFAARVPVSASRLSEVRDHSSEQLDTWTNISQKLGETVQRHAHATADTIQGGPKKAGP